MEIKNGDKLVSLFVVMALISFIGTAVHVNGVGIEGEGNTVARMVYNRSGMFGLFTGWILFNIAVAVGIRKLGTMEPKDDYLEDKTSYIASILASAYFLRNAFLAVNDMSCALFGQQIALLPMPCIPFLFSVFLLCSSVYFIFTEPLKFAETFSI